MIYIIQAVTGPIKIGIAENPRRRIAELQTANPYGLVMCGFFQSKNDRAFEAHAHVTQAADRLSGEWFRNSPIVCAYVQEILSAHGAELLIPPVCCAEGDRAPVQITQSAHGQRARKNVLPPTGSADSLPAAGFMRLKQVLAVFPVSRAMWYVGMAKGKYPRPCSIGERAKGYRVADIRALLERHQGDA
jgi:predicted DNA-binding transcriptional regulator AlpA